MSQTALRDDLLSIWRAGVDAVHSDRLMRQAVQCDGHRLTVCGQDWLLSDIDRIVVVGAGKAGAGMASELEAILGPELVKARVTGLVNVPADCVRPLQRITLHPGRPAGLNEPTASGVSGTETILTSVGSLQPRDLCLVLLSGGGSALLPAPVDGISLSDKQLVTRFLMSAGATIQELNAVRKRLSRIKGGGLARACPTGRMTTLIISDVVGDPLDIIASGPTVLDSTSPQAALEILDRYSARPPAVPQSVFDVLEKAAQNWQPPAPIPGTIRNLIIGNNSCALSAAADKARELGYAVQSLGSENQGEANSLGEDLYQRCLAFIQDPARLSQPPQCILSGGEPIVKLPAAKVPRKGGRNQQLVLAALASAWADNLTNFERVGILSGGTDGEDGPTDAAGAFVDAGIIQTVRQENLDPNAALGNCDAYPFFKRCGGLIKTGPTHTNVMDLRVALVRSL
ncbi:MAG: D-glycerate 2-kinase [Planctomycetaceae bacterium]|nr:D-glycerate 2-kinase [Planctomycetaceae bacterium]